uniref:Pentatricopeptide repeat-containing protein n=1 Tax=Vitis vinifera TaxID=29760 RepID=F6GUF9_VITVI
MQRVGLKPDNFTYPFVVKACGRSLVVGAGGAMHSIIVKAGFDSDRYVGNTLLRMYANLNAVGLARRVFNEMTVRDVVSWSMEQYMKPTFFSQKSNGKIQAMSVPGCPNISAMCLAVSHYKLILFSIDIDLIL